MLKDIFMIGSLSVVIIIVFIVFSLALFFLICHQLTLLLKIEAKSNVSILPPLTVDELNKELETFGFAYNLKQDIFFSIMYAWQREYGYSKSYDDSSPLLAMIIDCEPIYFTYDNRYWLIEFWKGQYGMTTGGEIGVYATKKKKEGIYDYIIDTVYESVTDDDLLHMSYKLKKKGKNLITRDALHWWLTGFKLGEFSKPAELVMDISITLKDEIMRDAFIQGLKHAGYMDKEIKIIYNTIHLTFNKPHTKQPRSKKWLITFIMQKYNKQNCNLYNSLTKNYHNSLEKINFIREQFPIMYTQIINMGKNAQLFKNTPRNRP